MYQFIEIGPELSSETAVFPGDCPFELNDAMSFEQGHHLKLSWLKTTTHIGAHADAPNHYHPDGVDITGRDLNLYFGPCQVIEVQAQGPRITIEDLQKTEITAARVLFKTGSFPNPKQWNSDFVAISTELIRYLGEKKVCLVGIDTPSVDPETSKDLPCHKEIYRQDMAILEGLTLEQVHAGEYFLCAIPLKIKGSDASPVRPVLIKTPSIF